MQKNRQKFAIWAPSHNFVQLYLRNEGMYRQSEKMLNSNISSICPHSIVNFGPPTAEIGLPVWGTPANFNGFRVLPSLLQRRRSLETKQTLHEGWYTICIFESSCPWRNFARCKIHFTSKSYVLLFWQRYCTALQHRASAKLCGVVQRMEWRNFYRGLHLYSAGRPSHWALAHILVWMFCVSCWQSNVQRLGEHLHFPGLLFRTS